MFNSLKTIQVNRRCSSRYWQKLQRYTELTRYPALSAICCQPYNDVIGCKSCNINHIPLTKMPYLSELCKTFESDGQEIKLLTQVKNFHFGVKYAVFIENENECLKNTDFATHGLMTIFNKWSKFQTDLINILGDMASQSHILLE